jgi:transposase
MRDRDLYARILNLSAPWAVKDVELDLKAEEVRVIVEVGSDADLACPTCGKARGRYDRRERRWRHLDTCQLKTVLVAQVPRVQCPEHGVLQVRVPWAEPGSAFTALFEALVIDWLKEACIKAVAERLRMSWDEVDGVQQRAVERGLARRGRTSVTRIGVDETSFQKRHEYVTVVTDQAKGTVVHVADDRKQETLEGWFDTLSAEERASIESVAMDMWGPYIAAVKAKVPAGEEKIRFDKYHVASHLGEAVDQVRRAEHRALLAEGDTTLTRTKHLWLQNPDNMKEESKEKLVSICNLARKTSRAWALKETAMRLWGYKSLAWARKAWQEWLGWASRSRLEPMCKKARMVRTHLQGILNAVVSGTTNALAESVNAKIQAVKRLACGFRNRQRFRNAIYFHCGGLDLYPEALRPTHTTS